MKSSQALLSELRELHPKIIDLSLGRTERLVSALGNPQDQMPPAIHIAGTNGKGSTLAFIQAILNGHGRKTHKFTSPHLIDFNERIILAGSHPKDAEPISEQILIDVLSRTHEANANEPITFFEITTAAAFLAFAEHEADYTLLETGLGGRLDATNIVQTPALTVITSISMDHQDYLGDSLGLIAGEKAGIMKPGVPCVVGPQNPDASIVIEARARELGTPLLLAGRDWEVHEQHGRMVYQDHEVLFDLPLPNLYGAHQLENAGLALAAVRQLRDIDVHQTGLEYGLQNAKWPARLQRINQSILNENLVNGSEIWLDGGHNAGAADRLAQSMADLEDRLPRPLHIICGMMNTKDVETFMIPFNGLAEFVGTISIPNQEKSFTALELSERARNAGLNAAPQAGLIEALQTSRSVATVPNRVLICGSLYLAGHVLEMIRSKRQ